MADDAQAPATKADLQNFMETLQVTLGDMDKRIESVREDLLREMDQRFEASEKRIFHHFDVVAENIQFEFQGAFHDKIDQHEDRLQRLEQHTGLVSA